MRCGDSQRATEELRRIVRMRDLPHPNLIEIENVWADSNYLVVAMELADGSLADLLDVALEEFGVPFVRHDVCKYITQTAAAIDFMNARRHQDPNGCTTGFQHCDVKPGNILLFGDHVKLSDFGLVRMVTDDFMPCQYGGTLAYSAPEVFNKQVSQWTDQFSLAVTYCELRTGKLPFTRSPSRFGSGRVQADPELSALTPEERTIVTTALSKQPRNRWPNCQEMAKRLAALGDR